MAQHLWELFMIAASPTTALGPARAITNRRGLFVCGGGAASGCQIRTAWPSSHICNRSYTAVQRNTTTVFRRGTVRGTGEKESCRIIFQTGEVRGEISLVAGCCGSTQVNVNGQQHVYSLFAARRLLRATKTRNGGGGAGGGANTRCFEKSKPTWT